MSAEIIKYASNAFLATKISFTNAIADLCEETGTDIEDVAKGMGADNRIGPSFIEADLGYGGSCFRKDLESFVDTSSEHGERFKLLEEVIAINENRVPRLVNRIIHRIGDGKNRPLEKKTVAISALAFKPNTDDMRDAKNVELCRLLLDVGAHLRAYDPVSVANVKLIIGEKNINHSKNAYSAAKGADAIVIVTEWREFTHLDLGRLGKSLTEAVMFDGQNIYPPDEVTRAGIEYHCIGQPTAYPSESS